MKRWNWPPLLTLFAAPPAVEEGAAPDAHLVERFVQGDATAFELLLRRHAKAVFGICARICRDVHDAEDAFQATFLVLARKAAGLRRGACLPAWLHRVARRSATRAALRRARIQRYEHAVLVDPPARAGCEDATDLRALLDAEIDRLADRFRLPVLLCYLHGLSTDAVARQLGIPRGTVLSRLATARQKLAVRLTRRGVTASATTAALVAGGIRSAVSATLVRVTARVVLLPSTTPTRAGLLAREILQMAAWKNRIVWALALAVLAGVGGGIWGLSANGNGQPTPTVAPRGEDKHPEAARPGGGAPPPGAERLDEADRQRAQRALEEQETRKAAAIRKLEDEVKQLEWQAKSYEDQIQELITNPLHPEYDEKVLVESIAALDRDRIQWEPILRGAPKGSAKAKELEATLEDQRAQRMELVARLNRQRTAKALRDRKVDDLERQKARYESEAAQLRDHLFRLRYDLGPFQAGSTDQALDRLARQVADLEKLVRKLAEDRK